jgi:hypothetical protein
MNRHHVKHIAIRELSIPSGATLQHAEQACSVVACDVCNAADLAVHSACREYTCKWHVSTRNRCGWAVPLVGVVHNTCFPLSSRCSLQHITDCMMLMCSNICMYVCLWLHRARMVVLNHLGCLLVLEIGVHATQVIDFTSGTCLESALHVATVVPASHVYTAVGMPYVWWYGR